MLRKLIPIVAAIFVIALFGYVHYQTCAQPESAKKIFFLSQSRACQLPGLIYELIDEDLFKK